MEGTEILKTILWGVPLFLFTVFITRIFIAIICYLIEILIEKIEDYRFDKRLNKKKNPEKDLIITKDQQEKIFKFYS